MNLRRSATVCSFCSRFTLRLEALQADAGTCVEDIPATTAGITSGAGIAVRALPGSDASPLRTGCGALPGSLSLKLLLGCFCIPMRSLPWYR
jgi:hypothetical protein